MDKNAIYEEKFRLRVSDFNCHDYLLPQAVLDLAQDVAGKHADILHIGFEDFIKQNRIWVLMRNRFVMEKYPPLYATVNVKTWPREKGRADFDRDTIIEDLNGNVLCKIQSKWVILDVVKRCIILPRNFEYPIKEICEEKTFETPFFKLEDFDCENLPFHEIETEYCDLDHNRHINNIQYAKYIMNSIVLEENERIHTFEIDYVHELSFGQKVKVYYERKENIIRVKGVSNQTNFIAVLEIEKK